jgi:hypothetical protein
VDIITTTDANITTTFDKTIKIKDNSEKLSTMQTHRTMLSTGHDAGSSMKSIDEKEFLISENMYLQEQMRYLKLKETNFNDVKNEFNLRNSKHFQKNG